MQRKWLKQIWGKGKHSAFTDLSEFNGELYCCFRQASNHISDDGKIVVLNLTTAGEVRFANNLTLPSSDLRDPKLSITPEGKLLLLAYARDVNKVTKGSQSQPVCWFSADGHSWSSPKRLGQRHWWLWRIRWHQQQAYGFAYNRGQNAIDLYAGLPRRSFEVIAKGALNKERHHLGYPNESDIVFSENGTAYAVVRRDADSYTAQLGIAKAPYKQWQWHDLGEYIGGPVMQYLGQEKAIVAGRRWLEKGPVTALWQLCFSSKKLTCIDILPSAGDNSYPGLSLSGNTLTISYYSSHKDNKSQIYLAQYEL